MDILFGAITPEQRQKDVELAVAEEYKVDPHAQHVDRVEEGEVYKSRDAKWLHIEIERSIEELWYRDV
jgi:hypothetical protein